MELSTSPGKIAHRKKSIEKKHLYDRLSKSPRTQGTCSAHVDPWISWSILGTQNLECGYLSHGSVDCRDRWSLICGILNFVHSSSELKNFHLIASKIMRLCMLKLFPMFHQNQIQNEVKCTNLDALYSPNSGCSSLDNGDRAVECLKVGVGTSLGIN